MTTIGVRVFGALFGAVAVYLFVFALVTGEDFGNRVLSAFMVGVVSVGFWVWADRRKQAAVNAETHDPGGDCG